MKNATLLFLVRKNPESGKDEILLAMKKRGFGVGKLNGVGGKFDETKDKTIEDTAIREAQEEIGIRATKITKVALHRFEFPSKPGWGMLVHAYLCRDWIGEPTESEEMKPSWYEVSAIPYDQMWGDDVFWLPRVLAGETLETTFSFDDNDKVISSDIQPAKF